MASLHVLFRCIDFPWSWRRLGEWNAVGKVTVSSGPSHEPCGSPTFSSPHKTGHGKEIDNELGWIELRRNAEFRGGVVKGVLVVPVVPSLSDGAVRDKRILTGVGHNIIWVVTVQMRRRVDKPGKVEDDAITKGTGHKERIPKVLSPKVLSDLCRPDITDVKSKPWVQLFLKGDTPIFRKISKIHFFSSLVNIGVLFHHKPANVGVEKTSGSIVGISIRFTEFVVDAVVTAPMVDTSLVGEGVAKHKEESDGPCSLIGSV